MKFDPETHHRRSIRLKGYDYTQAGAYFVTLVTWKRAKLFGEIVDGEMHLNEFGKVVREEWFRTAGLRPNVELHDDEFVVMPNHVHGILWIVEASQPAAVRARRRRALTDGHSLEDTAERFGKPVAGSLATLIRSYKSAVTYHINAIRETRTAPVWQRNYYEHIVRDEKELKNIWDYIDINPVRWPEDQLHPLAPPNRFSQEEQ